MLNEKGESKDVIINRQGKDLINMVADNNLIILKGRCPWDLEKEYTQVGSSDASVVDYILVSMPMVDFVKEMKVEGRVESDHMPLVLKERYEK